MTLNWKAVIFIIAGILILVFPNIIEYLIGIGLIVIGGLYFLGMTIRKD